ncbi:hypothetical protein ACFX14_044263 [Malus domestica]
MPVRPHQQLQGDHPCEQRRNTTEYRALFPANDLSLTRGELVVGKPLQNSKFWSCLGSLMESILEKFLTSLTLLLTMQNCEKHPEKGACLQVIRGHERRRNITAAMMLTLDDCEDFWPLSPLDLSSPLFSERELDAEGSGTATSQKDLVTADGASISGSKIVICWSFHRQPFDTSIFQNLSEHGKQNVRATKT